MIPTFYLNGPIGDGDNTAAALGRFLDDNPGPVRLVMNSPGGIATEGAAIAALVLRHGNVTVEIVGLAASAASLGVMGAWRIEMDTSAHLMIHEPMNLAFGTADDLRIEAGTLDKLSATYAAAYARATAHPVARIAAWMKEETWMTAEEALALNFCDAVTGLSDNATPEPVAAFDYTRFKHAPSTLIEMAAREGWTEKAEA